MIVLIIVMWILAGLAGLTGLFIIELLVAALYPAVRVQPQKLSSFSGKIDSTPGQCNRQDVSYDIDGIPISAWLYLPEGRPGRVPCIIMANGLGGTRDMLLDAYASRFQAGGLAVLAFDYRYNGKSGGEPRQLIWIPSQLEDYEASVGYARSREEIDPARIALWGTSLSGGHALVTAARDSSIACVAVQAPLIDGREAAEEAYHRSSLRQVLRMVGHGQRDLVRSWLGLSPHKIPVVGRPGTVALMADEDAWQIFNEMAPGDYINEACARISIRLDKYRPIASLSKISCPILLQICEQDIALPARVVERAVALLGKHVELKRYPIGHFDIYRGDNLVRAAEDQTRFYQRHLLGHNP